MRERKLTLDQLAHTGTIGRMEIERIKPDSVWANLETCKLTTVTAPSGYGKTTILKEWAAKTNLEVGWISLGEEDIQRVSFWKKVIVHMPGLPEQERINLLDILQSTSFSPTHFIATLCTCLRTYQVSGALIIDDFHMMMDSPELGELITWIEEMPDTYHIIISGQSFTGVSLKRLLRHQQVLQITKQDLILTVEELQQYVATYLHREPSEEVIANIMQQTKGWPAGLRLVHMYEQLREDYADLQFSNVTVARQLIQEIVYSLSESEQHYLLCSAVLNTMHIRLCDHLAGTRRGRVIIRRLKTQGLLVEGQEESGWFSLNRHLRNYLREMLDMQAEIDVKELYKRASDWYETQQTLVMAIHYASKAGDQERLKRLIIKAAPALLEEGRVAQLQEWISMLPRKYMYQLELGIIYGWVVCFRFQPELAERQAHMLEEQLLRRELQLTEEEEKRYFTDVYTLKTFISILQDDAKSTLDHANKSLVYSPITSSYFSHSFDYNRHDATIMHSTIGGGGDLRSVHRLYERLAPKITKESVFSGYYHICLAEIAYEWGQSGKAKRHLDVALMIADLFGLPGLLVPVYLLKARLEIEQQGNAQAAKATLHALKDMLTTSNAPSDWFKKAEAARVHIAIQQNDTDRIRNWLSLFVLQEPPIQQKSLFEYVTLVHAYAALNERETALSYIKKLMPFVKFGGRISAEIDLFVTQAVLLYNDDTDAALASLKQALRLSADSKYMRTYWLGGETVRNMVEELIQLEEVPKKQIKYVEQILAYWSEDTHDQRLQSKLTKRELQLVYQLQLGKRNIEIAQELALSLGTVKVYFHRIYEKLGVKNRKQAKEIAAGLDYSEIL
ncbi:LuxR family transcriptional regulator, maltose regulon positive regulatory protein [Terribacillus aidingensis]|uniref:LuxR family transcriptional regulator, maltose regulon positive regulatory protein n=1 Tax=Terribacillus aidingensis TaxID=586416 RepID=A0A285N5V0_9BACI|nr:LuxR C-terminal-related transcriptional regulator [Terribacillus aidingensis]SNZ04822.1 LuxR family transcriptional regulator, maltose regulon positive regulatory protein [Terribacillus aidingensis]